MIEYWPTACLAFSSPIIRFVVTTVVAYSVFAVPVILYGQHPLKNVLFYSFMHSAH